MQQTSPQNSELPATKLNNQEGPRPRNNKEEASISPMPTAPSSVKRAAPGRTRTQLASPSWAANMESQRWALTAPQPRRPLGYQHGITALGAHRPPAPKASGLPTWNHSAGRSPPPSPEGLWATNMESQRRALTQPERELVRAHRPLPSRGPGLK